MWLHHFHVSIVVDIYIRYLWSMIGNLQPDRFISNSCRRLNPVLVSSRDGCTYPNFLCLSWPLAVGSSLRSSTALFSVDPWIHAKCRTHWNLLSSYGVCKCSREFNVLRAFQMCRRVLETAIINPSAVDWVRHWVELHARPVTWSMNPPCFQNLQNREY